jgi:hypothetical protein
MVGSMYFIGICLKPTTNASLAMASVSFRGKKDFRGRPPATGMLAPVHQRNELYYRFNR